MQRSLYRVYLYGIIVFLLYFVSIATVIFLSVLLQETPLNGAPPTPVTGSRIVQPAVLVIISWIIALSFGGLHYWLLRRNEATDPSAANSAVRALFVNSGEAVAAIVAVGFGILAINLAALNDTAATPFAVLLVFSALFLLFELERRRMPAEEGAALELQRLNLSGVQLFFLVAFLLPALLNALSASLFQILLGNGVLPTCGPDSTATYCYTSSNTPSLQSLWLSVGVVALAWLVYWLLGLGDGSGNLVKTLHFLGLATGVIVALIGVERGAELLFRILLGIGATAADLVGSYNFIPPLLTGLLFIGIYIGLLRQDGSGESKESRAATRSAGIALAAALVAIPFWSGCVVLLAGYVGSVVPQGVALDMTTPLALILTGVWYIPLEFWLRARTRRAGASIMPRRALELALLALGMLGTAISVIVLLYAVLTATLGNPFDGWQQVARSAASTLVVTALLLVIYGRQVLRERGVAVEQKPPAADPTTLPVAHPPTGAAEPATIPSGERTIEDTLDDLLAGRVTRDEAAARMRSLLSASGSAPAN
jgi:hypothetical protein